MRERFTVGVLGTPFGVKGFIRVRSLSGEYDHIAALKAVAVAGSGSSLIIEDILRRPGALFLKFKGIDSPEAVKAFAGAELLASREEAAPLKAGEYYIEDLKGLRVISAQGAGNCLGKIVDVLEGGGGLLAEVIVPSGERKLVPFRNEFFGDISLENSTAVLLAEWILQ